MLDLQFYREQYAKTLEDLKSLYVQRGRASEEARGGIENRIVQVNAELKRLKEEIAEVQRKQAPVSYVAESAFQSPEDATIRLYVVVTTKEKVKANIEEECFCLLDEERYHQEELEKWKPFYEGSTIGELIQELENSFPIDVFYLENDPNASYAVKIEEEEAQSIGIIDLLSLNDENRNLASCFDSKDIAALILPQCKTLIKHPALDQLIQKKRKNIFVKFQNRITTTVPPTNYLFGLSEFGMFRVQLFNVFRDACKIRNQISAKRDVRSVLNMGNFQ